MNISLGMLMILTARMLAAAADERAVTEARRSDRAVELSVRCDDHPVPGPYKADVYLSPDPAFVAPATKGCTPPYKMDVYLPQFRTPNDYTAEAAIPAAALDRAQQGPWKEFRLKRRAPSMNRKQFLKNCAYILCSCQRAANGDRGGVIAKRGRP
jgi:hypothetical protein